MMTARAAPLEYDPEEPVIEAIRAGDRYAFGELVERQGTWVRAVVVGVLGNRDQVDDVVQQVWLAVWRRIAELRDPKRWRPWLYRIVRNAAIDAGRDATRKRARKQAFLATAATKPTVTVPGPHGTVDRDQHESVLEAIRALPILYREPFVLRHMSGWNYRQIAEVMGMPVDSVETRLVRARRFLREALRDCFDEARCSDAAKYEGH